MLVRYSGPGRWYKWDDVNGFEVASHAEQVSAVLKLPDSCRRDIERGVPVRTNTLEWCSHPEGPGEQYRGLHLLIDGDDSPQGFKKFYAVDLIPEPPAVDEKPSKPPATAERETMLKLIIGMAVDAYGYDPDATRNKATGDKQGSIKAALEMKGISIDADTIRKYLNEAKQHYPRKPAMARIETEAD